MGAVKMAMMGSAIEAWVISILTWFLRNLGCLKAFLSNTKMYEREAKMKYTIKPKILHLVSQLLTKDSRCNTVNHVMRNNDRHCR